MRNLPQEYRIIIKKIEWKEWRWERDLTGINRWIKWKYRQQGWRRNQENKRGELSWVGFGLVYNKRTVDGEDDDPAK